MRVRVVRELLTFLNKLPDEVESSKAACSVILLPHFANIDEVGHTWLLFTSFVYF